MTASEQFEYQKFLEELCTWIFQIDLFLLVNGIDRQGERGLNAVDILSSWLELTDGSPHPNNFEQRLKAAFEHIKQPVEQHPNYLILCPIYTIQMSIGGRVFLYLN